MRAMPLDFASLIKDRLVVVASPPTSFSAKSLIDAGARGVLMLRRGAVPERHADGSFSGGFTRPSDIARNNCSVAVLFGRAALVLADKRYFANFEHVLVSVGGTLLAGGAGLARYGARGTLRAIGTTTRADDSGGRLTFVVFKTKAKASVRSRLYGPAEAPLATLRAAADLNQVVLRSIESIEAGTHGGDVDILISAQDVEAFRARLASEIGTRPYDVYTESAELGYSYKRVPCFKPDLAAKILASAEVRASGLRAPSAKWRYLAFCYHVLFHDKLIEAAAAAELLDASLFRKRTHHEALLSLAKAAGYDAPARIGDLENAIKAENGFPGLDLMAFYAEHSDFVRARYIDTVAAPPGLAVFYVRDFGQGPALLDSIRAHLRSSFSVLAEGPVTDANRDAIARGVRGGNWGDKRAPGGIAPPMHWFVCWDKSPRRPSALMRWRYPRLDNANLRVKAHIRKMLGSEPSRGKPFGVVHASDNTLEALEHLVHLGMDRHPEVLRLGLAAAAPDHRGRAPVSR
jgi:hypothetical protein